MLKLAKLTGVLIEVLSTTSVAQQNYSKNTIPFATYEMAHSCPNIDLSSSGKACLKKKELKEIPSDEISAMVKKIKSDICSFIAPGTVEIWIGLDVDAKLAIVNSHCEGGIKVTFSCENRKEK